MSFSIIYKTQALIIICVYLLSLAGVAQSATTVTPVECLSPPLNLNVHPMDCCRVPELFFDKDYKACQMRKDRDVKRDREFREGSIPIHNNVPVCRAFPNWIHWEKVKCMFERHQIFSSNATGVIDRLMFHFHMVGLQNPSMRFVVRDASEFCFKKNMCPISFDHELNFQHRCSFCFVRELLHNCPHWKQSPNCRIVRRHIDKCLPYYEYFKKPWTKAKTDGYIQQ